MSAGHVPDFDERRQRTLRCHGWAQSSLNLRSHTPRGTHCLKTYTLHLSRNRTFSDKWRRFLWVVCPSLHPAKCKSSEGSRPAKIVSWPYPFFIDDHGGLEREGGL